MGIVLLSSFMTRSLAHLLALAQAGIDNLDVFIDLEAGKLDEAFRQIDDFHGIALIE